MRQIATGKGLGNTSKMDALIWEELGQNKEQTKLLATLIRTGVQVIENTKDEIDEDDYFTEGRVVTETHRRRERNPQVRSKLIEQRKTQGEFKCDICDCGPFSDEPDLAECIFEAHHIIPLSTNASSIKTRLEDMALLSASCHRFIHRAISLKKAWVSIDEAKKLLKK